MIHPSLVRVTKIVHSNGSTSTTLKGVLAFARKHGLKQEPSKFVPREKFKSFPIHDTTLGDGALNICQEKNPKLKNWNSPEATTELGKHNTVDYINEGRYSGRCSYIKWSYTPLYHSELKVAAKGAVAELWRSGKLVRTLYAPSGLKWGNDAEGPFLHDTKGTEYHPSIDDLKRKDFAANIRACLFKTRKTRKDSAATKKKNNKDVLTQAREYAKFKGSVSVTLQDSLESGNCSSGTINYLLNKGYDRRFILSPLAQIPASKLDDSNPRVKAAIERAINRSCLVSI